MKKFIFSAVFLIISLCSAWAQDARLCPAVVQTEGQGNGGNFLYLTINTRDAIMAGAPWKVQNVEYLNGFSPISVRVTNPNQLHPEYDYRLKIAPVADANDNSLISMDAHWTLEVLNGSTVVETYQSVHSIGQGEEELIPGHGIAITVKNHPYSIYTERSQNNAGYPNPTYANNVKYAQVDLLGSYIQYNHNSHHWLSGIKDVDSDSKNNWIRAGHFHIGPWDEFSGQNGASDEYEKWSKEDNHYLYWEDYSYGYYRAFRDYNAQFENMVNGTWCPYPVASPFKGGPQAKYITPDTSLTQEPQPSYYNFNSTNNNPTMINLYSVDIVLTPDQNKWTRAVVLEACEDSTLSVGHALRHEPRKSPSVDKNGNPDGTGYGMGWFPGYAINVETGERLNIMFSENSSDVANHGADMLFNPTSDTAHWGGCHFVYICGSSGSTCELALFDNSIQRNFNNNGIINAGMGGSFVGTDGTAYPFYDCGVYDEGKWLYEKFSTVTELSLTNSSIRKKKKMQLFSNVMWTSIVMPAQGEESHWLSDEATIYLRVSRPYMFYTSAVGTGPDNPLNNNAPVYVFNTREYANSAPQVLYQMEASDADNTIDVNNISAVLSAGSRQFMSDDYGNTSSFKVPKTDKKSTIFSHALWIGGVDGNDIVHLAAMQFGQIGDDFWPGPLSTTDASIDTETKNKWDRCFKITREEVIDFLNNYNTPGYEIPRHIEEWPAHGDVNKGQAYDLAPYVDVDGDNHYNPVHGDYPSFPGDMALFFIFNDNYAEHTETGGNPIGLEVHGMVYGFDAPEDTVLNNTLFFNYKLFNRSQNSLHDAYVGLWTDWDIGYAADDRVQCDVQRGTIYGYNGNSTDGTIGFQYHYGENPPIQTLTVLGGPVLPNDGNDNPAFSETEDCSLYVFNGNNQYAINGFNFGNGIVDDERMGLTGFIYHNNDNTDIGNPSNAIQYYNFLHGKFKDGTHMVYGGNGHPSYGGILGPECRFMFPGNSDHCNWGIIDSLQWTSFFSYQDAYFGYNGYGWTEEGLNWQPGDRRGLAIIGPFDFESNSMHEIDYCMITVFPSTFNSDNPISTDVLNAVDHIKNNFEDGEYNSHFTAPVIIETNESICEGEGYNFFGTSYTESGSYQHNVSAQGSTTIDTSYILNLTVIPNSLLLYYAILPGTSYNDNGFSIPASATSATGVQIHQTTTTTTEGCQVEVTLVLDVRNDVGIETVKRQQYLTLYPNPTTDFVQFDIQDESLLNSQELVMIYDLSGRLLQSFRPTAETVRINLSGYASGTYIVKLANYIGKIIKH